MKRLTLSKALKGLKSLKSSFRSRIRNEFEYRAKDCLTCETRGICCTDEHFVNVQITRLEAVAIRDSLDQLGPEVRERVQLRNERTIKSFDLTNADSMSGNKYACPLFEKEIGCLVHKTAKPIPCIQHACYENAEDLPPDELQTQQEKNVARLNNQTFGNSWNWLPLPIWLKKVSSEKNTD